ncbi:hypothetical protein LOD99_5962 [Oopsacas minuta]|uniref:Uncharacterized protein n=1 Tax=Oopsacas minuta TaxID=111878 RepID=A0AAV7JN74_9METZ|nr:hypothetical protein LOD99_5962 [Oopsacas minuta]
MAFNPRVQIIVFGIVAIFWAGLSTQIVMYKSILGVSQLYEFLSHPNASTIINHDSYVYMGVEGIVTSFLQTLALMFIIIGSFSSMIDLERTQIFSKLLLTFSECVLLLCVGFSIASSVLDINSPKLVLDIIAAVVYGLYFLFIAVYLILLHLYEVQQEEKVEVDEVFMSETQI